MNSGSVNMVLIECKNVAANSCVFEMMTTRIAGFMHSRYVTYSDVITVDLPWWGGQLMSTRRGDAF